MRFTLRRTVQCQVYRRRSKFQRRDIVNVIIIYFFDKNITALLVFLNANTKWNDWYFACISVRIPV